MKVVILGCGRVGAELAMMLERANHTVSIIDSSSESFLRIDPHFKGQKIVGNGVDEEVLKRAGLETADAFAAVTNGDNRNIMASQIAKEIFQVPKVVCRIYDPIRQSTYRTLGLDAFSPTIIGAEVLFNALNGQATDSAQLAQKLQERIVENIGQKAEEKG